ncbi:unnamed protein product [marine sediment metagenome]|uniref:Uncharacterized protein n=1 Tax=marine sediment metagenome TaxID=412755 RepID=X1DSK4_9ZZZZ
MNTNELLEEIRDRLLLPTFNIVSVWKALVSTGDETAGDTLNDAGGLSWVFHNMARKKGGSGYIVKAQVNTEVESVTPRIALQVYTKAPTCQMADSTAAVSPTPADTPYFVGEIEIPAMHGRGDNSFAVATPSTVGNLPMAFTCQPNSTALYIVPITVDAITYDALGRLDIELTSEQY